MKKTILTSLALGVMSVGLMAGNAMALPGSSLQGVLDGITKGPIAGSSSVDVTTDFVAEGVDAYWAIGGSGGSLATIVIELAGFANSNIFGLYDATDPSKKVTLFDGSASTGFQALVSILFDGSVIKNFGDTGIDFAGNKFGYFLDSPGGMFYSDSALNASVEDHMFAYQGVGDMVQILPYSPGPWGASEYVLAWEDLPGAGGDYDDFVVMVESVTPVPEPATMLLFGTGLASLAGLVTRRKKN